MTAEIALSRHEPRVAALQYAAAARRDRDEDLLRRAADVTAECLQPSLTAEVAARWLAVDPSAVDAHRAAAGAALELHHIDESAVHYRVVLQSSPRGLDAEFSALQAELAVADNVYGARQVADRLAGSFPGSEAMLRIQAFTALRADDPAASVRSFEAALALPDSGDERRDMTSGLQRAQILAGEAEEPLSRAKAARDADPVPQRRLDYALLLVAAKRYPEARAELRSLVPDPASKAPALRLLGLIDYQYGDLAGAGGEFADLATTGKFLDDALYYLGLIAERHDDVERALRLYAQVQGGDNAVPALLRAAAILRAHGAAPAAEQLLDQLVDDEPHRAPDIWVARSRIYSDAGNVSAAVAVLEQAEADYPDSVELRYAMASLVEQQGKVDLALQGLKSVVDSRPTDPAALNAYGYTLADNNRKLDEARGLIGRAFAAAPKNPAILDSLGWVLFRQGHPDQALDYLTGAYADEHDGDIAAHLGEVLWALGQRAEADRIWAEAARSNLDNHLLKATQSRLHASN